jgi:hypothetical protein
MELLALALAVVTAACLFQRSIAFSDPLPRGRCVMMAPGSALVRPGSVPLLGFSKKCLSIDNVAVRPVPPTPLGVGFGFTMPG